MSNTAITATRDSGVRAGEGGGRREGRRDGCAELVRGRVGCGYEVRGSREPRGGASGAVHGARYAMRRDGIGQRARGYCREA